MRRTSLALDLGEETFDILDQIIIRIVRLEHRLHRLIGARVELLHAPANEAWK